MSRFLSVVLVLFVGAAAVAQTPVVAVDVTSLPDGTYILTKAPGGASVRPLQLISPNSPIPPTPTPPPAPTPGPLNVTAMVFADKAKFLSTQAKQQLPAVAMLYRSLAKTVRDGQIKDPATLAAAVKASTDLVLSQAPAGVPNEFNAIRADLGDRFNQLAQSGTPLLTYATLLEDVAAGIESVAPRSIDPATLQLILEIVKIILALFVKPT